jgi:hypothetical protein
MKYTEYPGEKAVVSRLSIFAGPLPSISKKEGGRLMKIDYKKTKLHQISPQKKDFFFQPGMESKDQI